MKTRIDNPFQWKPPSDLLKIAEYNKQRSSKYWGTKAAFHTTDFCPQRFFCWSFKTEAVGCDNILTTLEKTFMSKCDINFFKIILSPHSFHLGNFFITVGVVPGIHFYWWWYLFSTLIYYDKLIKQSPWRCSRKKAFLLYLGNSQEN